MTRFGLILCVAATFGTFGFDTGGLTNADLFADDAGDWPQWRGPMRDGVSRESGLLKSWEKKQPKLVWRGEGLGAGYASVSVAGGRVFTSGNLPSGQSVVAVDGQSGKVIWTSPIDSENPKHSYEGSRSTPTIDGDRLYVVGSSGIIACMKSENGELLWRKNFREWKGRMMSGWGYSESPLVDGNLVLCTPGGADAMMVALDKLTGNEVWRTAIPNLGSKGGDGAAYSSIVTSNGAGVKQYVQLVGRGVIGVRASDGKYQWGYNNVANGTANVPTPIVSGDFVFCSTGYGAGGALLKLTRKQDAVDATEMYFLDGNKFQNHHGGMVLIKDHIYAGHGHNNGIPICLELKSGKTVWGGKTRGPGSGSAAITAADGHLIFRYTSGELALIEASPESFRLKGSFKPSYQERESWSQPVVAGGRLYLREQDKLMCYELRPGT